MRAWHRSATGSSLPPALGVRTYCLLGALAIALVSCPALLATDPPQRSAQHDAYDIRTALRVRRALAQDAELARYPVCVTARQGIVTLWGRVPSDALVERAVRIVRRVPGVFQVRSDLKVAPMEPDRDEVPRLPRSIAVPRTDEPGRGRDQRSRGVLAGNPREPPPSLADAAWIGRPEAARGSLRDTAPPAVLLPPRPADKQHGLTNAVDRLLRSDVRFAGLRAEERAGVVTLRGTVALMDHVMELARQVSRVPGVKEVVVENVRASPR